MSSTFQRPVNNFETTLASAHTAGSGTLSLASGAGTLLGTLGDNEVYRVTVFESGLSETVLGVFEATGRTGDQLTGVTAVEGYTDAALSSGVSVAVRATAKTFSDIYTAINALEVVSETAITGAVTLDSAAYGRSHVCSGTAADYTVTLPTAVGATGETIAFRMSSALTRFVTLDGSGAQTINGQASRVMHHGETIVLVSDGANWGILGGTIIPLVCMIRQVQDPSGASQSIPTDSVTQVTLTQSVIDNSTRMADTGSNRITVRRSGLYQVSAKIVWSNAAVMTRAAVFVRRNGSETVVSSELSNSQVGAYFTPQAIGPLSLTAGDQMTLHALNSSGASRDLFSTPSDNGPFLSLVEVPSW